jgi:hypothetical protein
MGWFEKKLIVVSVGGGHFNNDMAVTGTSLTTYKLSIA